MTVLARDETFTVDRVPAGSRRILLVNPPVYDAQYWARWSQPAGLLRIATHLKRQGYAVDLIDCMETNPKGMVPKTRLRGPDGAVLPPRKVDDVDKTIWHFGLTWADVRKRMLALERPDEVWITSIMTYWWESTRDAVSLVRDVFPAARTVVGGIYPTLAPEHAQANLGADVVFVGEMTAASDQWTDMSLYDIPPTYAILATTRGCPWDCSYCAARTLNGGSNRVRARERDDVLDEIEHKMKHFNIRHFGFYEDNTLVKQGHLQGILEVIVDRGHKLDLYAPEGFETRFLTIDVLRVMRKAGFRKVHLPFETLKMETNLSWNRRHSSTASFDRALDAAIEAGFQPRSEEINAFVLFGLPDESLADVMDSVLYVHHKVGSIIPMLFTPVPGTQVFRQHLNYLQQFDLHDLNGKFLPFLDYNRERDQRLRASDYMQLEALMSVLNCGKVFWRSVDVCDETAASTGFRSALRGRTDSWLRAASCESKRL